MTQSEDCLFCKIVARKVPSSVVRETAEVFAIKDINPQAPVHVLCIAKTHIPRVHELTPSRPGLMDSLVLAANQIAAESKIKDSGYRLVVNCGKEGGQTVDHLHLHLLGGRPMHWPPG